MIRESFEIAGTWPPRFKSECVTEITNLRQFFEKQNSNLLPVPTNQLEGDVQEIPFNLVPVGENQETRVNFNSRIESQEMERQLNSEPETIGILTFNMYSLF